MDDRSDIWEKAPDDGIAHVNAQSSAPWAMVVIIVAICATAVACCGLMIFGVTEMARIN